MSADLPDEDPARRAEQEFAEELGNAAPDGPRHDLGEVTQAGGKRVRAWAVHGDFDAAAAVAGQANASDRINVTGTANMAGTVKLQVTNVTSQAFSQTIVSANDGTAANGLTLVASPALQARLVFPNATDVVVKGDGVNFTNPDQTGNQMNVGKSLNGAVTNA